MTILLGTLGAVVALTLAYFLFGGMVARWLDRECNKMLNEAKLEDEHAVRFWNRGLPLPADWHYGNAEILRRNARACKRVAGWLR